MNVSFGSKVIPRTFGCVAIVSAGLFILRSRLLLYYAGSGVNRVQDVLSGFNVGLFCFVQAKSFSYESSIHSSTLLSRSISAFPLMLISSRVPLCLSSYNFCSLLSLDSFCSKHYCRLLVNFSQICFIPHRHTSIYHTHT